MSFHFALINSKAKTKDQRGNGCWINKIKFFVRCFSSRTIKSLKDGSKSPNVTRRDQHVVPIETARVQTSNALATINTIEELKFANHLQKFSFSDLKSITGNFRPQNLLGEGGFGRVYKGWLVEHNFPLQLGTRIPVAVKTLNQDGFQGHKEWLAEVSYLGRLYHPNVVKLVGYCIEDDQRLLVYEFMPRGSLENHLFRKNQTLSWATRMRIALGAAKGLSFLHEEAEQPVIFRDFKTSNILLDGDFNVKLSDFGLAKDAPEGDETHISTRVMGTHGYTAPEYVKTGHLTSKCDVYSFGVVLLELLTGRRCIDENQPNDEQNLVALARPCFQQRRKFFRLMDPALGGRFSLNGCQEAVQLAADCLNWNPKERPPMSEVVKILTPLPYLNDIASSAQYISAGPNAQGGNGMQPRYLHRNSSCSATNTPSPPP